MNRRPQPYCWVTWITGLLVGSERCHWKVWMKAHYKLPRVEESAERQASLNDWLQKHDTMTAARVEELKREGYVVTTEDDNSFILRGETANLAGKPDIIALKPQEKVGLIIDEKAGRPKDQYIWQVLIYMFAKAFTFPDYILTGEIEYKDSRVPVLPRQLNAENKRRIGSMMQIIGGSSEPPRVPSKMECQYCDILHCPDRYESKEIDARAHF